MTTSLVPNKDRLRLWCEDLEEGGHQQIQNKLSGRESCTQTEPDGFCCVGRACELALPHTVMQRVIDPHSYTFTYYDPNGPTHNYTNTPPASVATWFGLPDDAFWPYAKMNDAGRSFADIAAQIRKDYDL